MKKKKEYNLFNRLRAALRDVYRYSPMRREAVTKVTKKALGEAPFFYCDLCKKNWPIQMAEVDHNPPLGPLNTWDIQNSSGVAMWSYNLFYGPVRVICKLCHKKVTASQRKKK